MTLPQNDLSGFATDDEVPMVELSDDDMILRDSQGMATAVVDKSNFYEAHKSKKRTKKSHSKQSNTNNPFYISGTTLGQAGESPLPPPPGLAYYNNSPKMSQPNTPKTIPPFFQFVGAVAGKAKEFFSGPPVSSVNSTPAQPNPTTMYQQQSGYYSAPPGMLPNMPQQKVPYSAYNGFPYSNTPQIPFGQQPGFLQPPEPPVMGYMGTPGDLYEKPRHKKKSKKHSSKHKHKKSKSSISSGISVIGEQNPLTSPLLLVLIFLGSGFIFMLTRSRPPVTGPISGALDKALYNIQIGAVIAFLLSTSILAWKFLGPDPNQGPAFSPASSIPAAGTFLDSPSLSLESSAALHPMEFFPGMQPNGPLMGQPGNTWMGFPQGGPGMPGVPGGLPGAFSSGYQGAPPNGMYGMPGGPGLQGPPNQFFPFGQYDDEETDDEFGYMPAGSFESKHQFRGRGYGPISPAENIYGDGLSRDIREEEGKTSFYETMPALPNIDDADLYEPEIYSLLREGPDPELLTMVEKKRNHVQTKGEKKSSKDTKKSGKEKKASNKDKSDERIKGTNKKKENCYFDEYACKPYGPPPKRYRGVNI